MKSMKKKIVNLGLILLLTNYSGAKDLKNSTQTLVQQDESNIIYPKKFQQLSKEEIKKFSQKKVVTQNDKEIQSSLQELKQSINSLTQNQSLVQQDQQRVVNKKREISLKEFDDQRWGSDGMNYPANKKIFHRNYDHQGYQPFDVAEGMENIKVLDSVQVSSGKKCDPGDQVAINYKTLNLEGKKLEDSQLLGDGDPYVFQMGNYLVPKCWELTINTLHEGDKIKIKCPSYLGYGGNEKWSQFSNEKIPAFSDLVFQIQVLTCEESIAEFNKKNQKQSNGARQIKPVPVQRSFLPKKKADSPAFKKVLKKVEAQILLFKKSLKAQKLVIKQQIQKQKAIEKKIFQSSPHVDVKKLVLKMMYKEQQIFKQQKVLKDKKKKIALAKKAVNLVKAKTAKNSGDKIQKLKAAIKKATQQKKPVKLFENSLGTTSSFYIQFLPEDKIDQTLVLEVQQKDKYYPQQTGIHKVDLQVLKSGISDEEDRQTGNHKEAQQWTYSPYDGALESLLFKGKVLIQLSDKSLVIFDQHNLKNQQFGFDKKKQVWFNLFSNDIVQLDGKTEPRSGAKIVSGKYKKKGYQQKWKIRESRFEKVIQKKKAAGAKSVKSLNGANKGSQQKRALNRGNKRIVNQQNRNVASKRQNQQKRQQSSNRPQRQQSVKNQNSINSNPSLKSENSNSISSNNNQNQYNKNQNQPQKRKRRAFKHVSHSHSQMTGEDESESEQDTEESIDSISKDLSDSFEGSSDQSPDDSETPTDSQQDTSNQDDTESSQSNNDSDQQQESSADSQQDDQNHVTNYVSDLTSANNQRDSITPDDEKKYDQADANQGADEVQNNLVEDQQQQQSSIQNSDINFAQKEKKTSSVKEQPKQIENNKQQNEISQKSARENLQEKLKLLQEQQQKIMDELQKTQ